MSKSFLCKSQYKSNVLMHLLLYLQHADMYSICVCGYMHTHSCICVKQRFTSTESKECTHPLHMQSFYLIF